MTDNDAAAPSGRAKSRRVRVHVVFVLFIVCIVGAIAWQALGRGRGFDSIDRTTLLPAQDGQLWGYVNAEGQWAIPAQFQVAKLFIGDRARAAKGGSWGWIDRSGACVVPFGTYDLWTGRQGEGLTIVIDGGKHGYVTDRGELAIPTVYDCAEPFEDGIARVARNGLWGCIGHDNKVVVPFVYDEIMPFRGEGAVEQPEQFTIARLSTGLPSRMADKVLIDRSGVVVLGPGFVGPSKVRLYPVMLVREFAWIGQRAEGLIPVNAGGRMACFGGRDDVACVGGKWGFVNLAGDTIIPPQFDRPGVFKLGVADVVFRGKPAMIDKWGNTLTEAERADVEEYELLQRAMRAVGPVARVRNLIEEECARLRAEERRRQRERRRR